MVTDLLLRPMADAFMQVGVFVAVLVALSAWLRVRHGTRVLDWLERHRRRGPAIGALLGVSPGCGGAILVIPLYVRGRVTYGTVVAAVTATMGDSSWVIMAGDPAVALLVHAILLGVGLATGYAVDAAGIDPRRRLQPSHGSALPPGGSGTPTTPASLPGTGAATAAARATAPTGTDSPAAPLRRGTVALDSASTAMWLVAAAASLLAVPAAFRVVDQQAIALRLGQHDPWLLLGVSGTLACFAVFLASGRRLADDDSEVPLDLRSALTHGAVETAFVVVWVTAALVLTALLALVPGADGGSLPFHGAVGIAVAAVVGLIPGCGLQIALTGLYLSGTVPFAALLANAVSQDGDALFPLIALDRRAAVFTTALTTVPALAVGFVALVLT